MKFAQRRLQFCIHFLIFTMLIVRWIRDLFTDVVEYGEIFINVFVKVFINVY